MIDQASLHQLLDYDPATGLFRWRKNRTNGVKRGDIAGCLDKEGYIVISVLGKQYRAHQLAWFFVHGTCVLLDHIDGVRSNNRLSNLREATHSQNCANRRSLGRYLKGVYFKKRDRLWEARIWKDGKSRHLGCFKSEAEAHSAYCQAANEHFGEFAWPLLRGKAS